MLSLKIYRFIFWLCLTSIFVLATIPLNIPKIDVSYSDKINHVVAFIILWILFTHAYLLKIWLAFIVLLGYGFLLECIQRFIPYRDFSWLDLIADAVGLSIGFIMSFFLTQLINKDKV